MKKNDPKAIFFLILTAVIWGFAFAFQTEGGESLKNYWFNGIRFYIGSLSLLPVIFLFERKRVDQNTAKKTILYGMLTGAILFSASTLQQYGILLTHSPGKSGFITGLYMIFVPLCGIFMRRHVQIEAWLGVAFGVVGLFLISFRGGAEPFEVGDLLTLLGAFFWTAHILVVDKFGSILPPLKYSLCQFLTTGTLCLLLAPILEPGVLTPEHIQVALIPLLYCGICSVGVAYTCQVLGQRGTEPALASIILCAESVFAAIGGALILHENLGLRAYIGCALIFLGILCSQIKIFPKSKA